MTNVKWSTSFSCSAYKQKSPFLNTSIYVCVVFARSKAGIVGSTLTQVMNVCVCVYSVFVLSCVCVAALRRPDHSSKEIYRMRKMITRLKKRSGPNKGCRAIDE
jgi:hypothetical protein